MDTNAALRLLLDAHCLKRTPRTGRVVQVRSDRGFGVAPASLTLSELIEELLDRAKLLTIALLHDSPESVIGDIPPSTAAYLPPEAKPRHRCWASC